MADRPRQVPIREFNDAYTFSSAVDANVVCIRATATTATVPTAPYQRPAGVTEYAYAAAEAGELITKDVMRCLAGVAISTDNEPLAIAGTSGRVGPALHGTWLVGYGHGTQTTVGGEIGVKLAIGQKCDRTGEVTAAAGATHTMTASDYVINCDYTATGAVTVTIPTALIPYIKELTVKDSGGSAGTNAISIATEGSETIDGGASASISANDGSVTLYSDGTNLFTK